MQHFATRPAARNRNIAKNTQGVADEPSQGRPAAVGEFHNHRGAKIAHTYPLLTPGTMTKQTEHMFLKRRAVDAHGYTLHAAGTVEPKLFRHGTTAKHVFLRRRLHHETTADRKFREVGGILNFARIDPFAFKNFPLKRYIGICMVQNGAQLAALESEDILPPDAWMVSKPS